MTPLLQRLSALALVLAFAAVMGPPSRAQGGTISVTFPDEAGGCTRLRHRGPGRPLGHVQRPDISPDPGSARGLFQLHLSNQSLQRWRNDEGRERRRRFERDDAESRVLGTCPQSREERPELPDRLEQVPGPLVQTELERHGGSANLLGSQSEQPSLGQRSRRASGAANVTRHADGRRGSDAVAHSRACRRGRTGPFEGFGSIRTTSTPSRTWSSTGFG